MNGEEHPVVKLLVDKGLVEPISERVKPNRRIYTFKPERIREIISTMINNLGHDYFYISTVIGTDFPDKKLIRLDYYIVLLPGEETIVLRTWLPRDNPVIDSILDIYPGVLNAECETYDLLGVVFKGNPALKRGFFVPSDLVEKNIYPLRKDSGV